MCLRQKDLPMPFIFGRPGMPACFRTGLLLMLIFPIVRVQAEEISWLKEVTTPPAVIPVPARPLHPLLQTKDGQPVKSVKNWEPVRKEIRDAWMEFLGPLPPPAKSLDVKVLQRDELDDLVREWIEYSPEAGRRVRAYVVRPLQPSAQPRPAVVIFHGTTPETARPAVGLGTRKDRNTGLKLARQGFVAICPANFLWEEPKYLDSVAAARKRNPHSLGMITMLNDGMRAVDVLLTFPDVDPQRIGAIGHSLGGKETLYLMAFDDRIRAGVASEGGLGLNSTNWDAPWYLGPDIKKPDFPRDHHELVAMIAPRPFLVLGGETGRGCSDGDRSWPYLLVGQEVSRLYGPVVRQGLLNHHEGHQYSEASQQKAFEWLRDYCGHTDADR